MKYIINFVVLVVILSSCKKEEPILRDMMISADEITKIELRSDHKTLLPNGIAEMEFNFIVSATKEVTAYIRKEDKTFETVVTKHEFVVPKDQVEKGLIKIYDETGKEIKDNIYSTTSEKAGTVKRFHAEFRNLRSNDLTITIREIPKQPTENIVVPVVFHVISLPPTGGPTYDVSTEYLENQLKIAGDIFNGKMTTDPNGGNVNISFKLAEYTPSGNKMQSKGRTSYTLTATEMKTILNQTSSANRLKEYKAIILARKSTLIYEPSSYFNVWLIKFSTATGISESYKYIAPAIMHPDYEYGSIPGIKFTSQATTFTLKDVSDCLQAGIIVNFTPFFNPSVQGQDEFNFATPIAGYYGLLDTNNSDYNTLNSDGDNDFCPDTYVYYSSYYPSIYKGNNLNKQPEICPERPLEFFTSFNIMDRYSRKNSVSVDQAARIRKVLEQCPERYAYKSSFAFTGK